MRIVQVIDSLSVGGMERFVVNLSNLLSHHGVEVCLIVTRDLGELESDITEGVAVYHLKKAHFFDLKAFCQFYNLLKKLAPDSVHAHGPSIYWSVLVSIFSCGKPYKLIYHEHDGGFLLKSFYRKKILKYSLRFVHLILVVSKRQHQYFSSFHKDVYHFNNFPVLDQDLNLSRARKKLRFIHLANFRPEKNHQFLLKVIREINRRNLHVEFLLIGRHYGDTYYSEVKDIIEDMKADNVTLLHNVSNPSHYLFSADIGLITSKYEGLPLSLLEYGIAELAVISTDVGEISSLINCHSGFLVAEEVELFVDKLEYLIKNKETRLRFGRGLNRIVTKSYSQGAYLQSYLGLLSDAKG